MGAGQGPSRLLCRSEVPSRGSGEGARGAAEVGVMELVVAFTRRALHKCLAGLKYSPTGKSWKLPLNKISQQNLKSM